MKVVVTGGTGFIGRHVVSEILKQGFEVVVTGTNSIKASNLPWFKDVKFVEFDINKGSTDAIISEIVDGDMLLHLVWPGLPNYNSLSHFENNLLPQYNFLKKVIEAGCENITITGTCLEYGMKTGMLSEEDQACPANPYALAKDTLHKFLLELKHFYHFRLKWVRLFYMYGEGQSASSILSQLDKAIADKLPNFNMSKGEQVRDYLSVTEVAQKLVKVLLHEDFDGVINCCSGNGIKIKELVETYLRNKNHIMKLNLGYYPYNDYEPFDFWGNNTKWNYIFE